MRHRKERLHSGFEHRRRSDIRNLAAAVILYEKVITTRERARQVKAVVDRMITHGKKGNLAAIRRLNQFFTDRNAAKKIIEDLVPKFKDRNSGFTRVVKIGHRSGDAAPKVLIELLIPHREAIKEKIKPKSKIKVQKKIEEPKGWLERARELGRKVTRKDSKVITRTTSK